MARSLTEILDPRLAKDVDAALKAVVQRDGAMDAEAANAYVARMAQERRYVRDVY